jgi:glutamine synthetase
LQKAHERGVTAVELWVTDPFGRVQTIWIPIDALDQALDDGFVVSPEALGEAFEPLEGEQHGYGEDARLAPDPATFMSPSEEGGDGSPGSSRRSGRLICDLRHGDGAPAALCSRTALKRALGRATRVGSLFYVGATLQHHWVRRPDEDHPLSEPRLIRVLGEETARSLEALGIAWRAHYLGRDGRFCLELDWVDPLTLADAIVTHRRVVHDVAQAHDVSATFAPFPWSAARSRLDLIVSLSRDGASVFQNTLEPEGLAPGGKAFIAALEREMGALELVMRSTLHSYGTPEAPVIRQGPSTHGEGGATILIGGADACANPYSFLAAVIGLGAPSSDADGAGDRALPPPAQTLLEAAHRASHSSRLKDILGAALIDSLGSMGEL